MDDDEKLYPGALATYHGLSGPRWPDTRKTKDGAITWTNPNLEDLERFERWKDDLLSRAGARLTGAESLRAAFFKTVDALNG